MSVESSDGPVTSASRSETGRPGIRGRGGGGGGGGRRTVGRRPFGSLTVNDRYRPAGRFWIRSAGYDPALSVTHESRNIGHVTENAPHPRVPRSASPSLTPNDVLTTPRPASHSTWPSLSASMSPDPSCIAVLRTPLNTTPRRIHALPSAMTTDCQKRPSKARATASSL